MNIFKYLATVVLFSFLLGCGINSVSKGEIERVKVGDVITYRYQKGGKSWFYADRVTRVEGDRIYYNPSKSEATAGNDSRLKEFDLTRELSISKAELLKYETEQGEERKVVIWID